MREKSATVRVASRISLSSLSRFSRSFSLSGPSATLTLTIAHITPLVALLAGILILIVPRLLSFIVAIYLIIVGLIGLNAIHHFIR